jgi:hypothetical protein
MTVQEQLLEIAAGVDHTNRNASVQRAVTVLLTVDDEDTARRLEVAYDALRLGSAPRMTAALVISAAMEIEMQTTQAAREGRFLAAGDPCMADA